MTKCEQGRDLAAMKIGMGRAISSTSCGREQGPLNRLQVPLTAADVEHHAKPGEM